jgi:oxygen-independent coproporphyrinogen-3 oxidase
VKKRDSLGFSLYIHIPFCIKKCNYCDFVSFKYSHEKLKKYISYLKKEIVLYGKLLGKQINISTIYLGGGTPSLLSGKELSEIINEIEKYFHIKNAVEFTLEVNPETVTLEKFTEYRRIGVNRISMGAQSFNDSTLKILGRIHDSKKIYKAFKMLRKANFENINLDLMFALPGESLKDTLYSLKEAVKLNPEHISYYSLMLEEGTLFFKMKDKLRFPCNDTEFVEYRDGINILKSAGYSQYEISNFAKPGFQSIHNIQYWKNLPYIGLGVSAASYITRKRYKNVSNIEVYCNKINEGVFPTSFSERLTKTKAKAEHIIMGLRMRRGFDKRLYYTRFGNFPETDFKIKIEKLKKQKLLKETKNYISLTKKGIYIANTVFEEFLP